MARTGCRYRRPQHRCERYRDITNTILAIRAAPITARRRKGTSQRGYCHARVEQRRLAGVRRLRSAPRIRSAYPPDGDHTGAHLMPEVQGLRGRQQDARQGHGQDLVRDAIDLPERSNYETMNLCIN